jgi:phosphatidylglycerol:prolipoprotein diacylglycerol transferase
MPEAAFGTIPYFELPSLHLPLGLEIHPFGVLVAIGVLVGASLAARAARTYGPGDDTPLRDVVIWALVGGITGAHLLHVLGYHPELLRQDDPFALLKFWDGLSSMGGVVGSLIGISFFFRWRKIPLRPYLDALALGAAPGWAIARIGCIVAHDHPGVLTNFPLAVAYPDGPRHDLGLYDFFVLAILSGILYLLARRLRPQGFLMAVLAIGYSVPRFFLDFLRARDVAFADGRILGLTPAQYVAPVLVIAGIWLLRTPPPRMAGPMRLPDPSSSASISPSPSGRGSG